jgi:hypothetical protein
MSTVAPQKGTIPRLCKQCNAPFMAFAYKVKIGEGLFCSKRCASEFKHPRMPEAFWSHVEKTDGCWIWHRGIDKQGYGTLKCWGKVSKAHRVSWELHNGPIPDDLFVCHKCDNPPCVNPEHLFLGTNKDNCDDRDRKGRVNTVLTAEQVLEIRSLCEHGMLQRVVAARYGVQQSLISLIVNRKIWTHI